MSDELARATMCPIHEINPMHPELLQSPWGMNKRLREEAPVFQDPNTGIFFIFCSCIFHSFIDFCF